MEANKLAVNNRTAQHAIAPSIPVRDTAGGFTFIDVESSVVIPTKQIVDSPVVTEDPLKVNDDMANSENVPQDVAVVETVSAVSQESVPITVSVETSENKKTDDTKNKKEHSKETVKFANLEEPKPKETPSKHLKIKANSTSLQAEKPEAKFYIDSEDELEAEKINIPEGVKSYQSRFDHAGKTLAKELDSSLKPALLERFTRIIVSRWKDIRNHRETLEVLMRDKRLGGMGFQKSVAESFAVTIDKKKNSVLNHTYPKSPEVSKGKSEPKSIFDESKKLNVSSTQESKPSVVNKPKPSVSVSFMTEIKPRKGSRTKSDPVTSHNKELPRPIINTVGPIEELEKINMEYLRHLNKDPKKSAQKIYQKIDLLGDESFEVKAQGIRAWKRSPAYQMYLDIGQKSIEEKIPVEEVIDKKLAGDMTLEEFETIADLNKSLQF